MRTLSSLFGDMERGVVTNQTRENADTVLVASARQYRDWITREDYGKLPETLLERDEVLSGSYNHVKRRFAAKNQQASTAEFSAMDSVIRRSKKRHGREN